MLKTILEAIKPYFDRMPRPVQVGAFVIAIALMIYVIVYPNVISGELLVKKGDVIHKFRGTDVEVPYGGHLFVQRTDNRGRWVVPAPKIPKAISLRVNVGSPDAPEWESIMIESSAYVLGGFVSITWNSSISSGRFGSLAVTHHPISSMAAFGGGGSTPV